MAAVPPGPPPPPPGPTPAQRAGQIGRQIEGAGLEAAKVISHGAGVLRKKGGEATQAVSGGIGKLELDKKLKGIDLESETAQAFYENWDRFWDEIGRTPMIGPPIKLLADGGGLLLEPFKRVLLVVKFMKGVKEYDTIVTGVDIDATGKPTINPTIKTAESGTIKGKHFPQALAQALYEGLIRGHAPDVTKVYSTKGGVVSSEKVLIGVDRRARREDLVDEIYKQQVIEDARKRGEFTTPEYGPSGLPETEAVDPKTGLPIMGGSVSGAVHRVKLRPMTGTEIAAKVAALWAEEKARTPKRERIHRAIKGRLGIRLPFPE